MDAFGGIQARRVPLTLCDLLRTSERVGMREAAESLTPVELSESYRGNFHKRICRAGLSLFLPFSFAEKFVGLGR